VKNMKYTILGEGKLCKHLKETLNKKGNEEVDVSLTENIFYFISEPPIILNDNPIHSAGFITALLRTLDYIRLFNPNAKFIFTSTGSVYGEALLVPENERHPLQIHDFYNLHKITSENYIELYSKMYNIQSTILRLFNICGPEYKDSVVTKFIHQAKNKETLKIDGDGEQIRSFTHIEDVIQSLILASENTHKRCKIYNISSGEYTSLVQLVSSIARICNIEICGEFVSERPNEIRVFKPDISLARKELKFCPKYNLEKIIGEIANEI